ncbi:MAG: acetyl-CoA hydrolase/transferase C-terminal domain-containing protein [Dehalococcoidia bacterium]|nr:acetyl-CoA hydrolase/transferase C-terminal domain-containing protein [Dehalococcoidia bacterium]
MTTAKITTAEEAIRIVKSGDLVILGTGCAEPQTLVAALIRQRDRLEGVRLLTMIPAGSCEYAAPEMVSHFQVSTFVGGGGLYSAQREGRIDYIPCNLSEIPRLFANGYICPDVALIQVSPPDEHGFCTFGISVDYIKAATAVAKFVVAEINDRMPRTCGDTRIHLSEIDFAVESSLPLTFVESPSQLNEVESAIGAIVAGLIPDGSTIQVGIGGIPDAVLRSLRNRRDLRMHTGILPDGVLELVRSGALAPIGAGRTPIVATIAEGSQQLYDYMHNNPAVELHPCNYTHHASTLAQITGLVSVNSAVQIDLTGQVNAEFVGGIQISGVGGQIDFIRGASLAPEGKSVVALQSTASRGQVSRIVAKLPEGCAVTTPRHDVHFVVTEFGVADLRGKSLRERARALAAIAHPGFRAQLLTEVNG